MDNHFHALRHWAQGYLNGNVIALPTHLAEAVIETVDEIERAEARADRLKAQLDAALQLQHERSESEGEGVNHELGK